jgi:predicted nucleic acid-binding protein
MNVLFDTNVALDVLMNRAPHAEAAAELWSLVERKELGGLLGATTMTTLHYLATKAAGREAARSRVRKLLSLFEVAPVTWDILSDALNAGFPDFEDAVLYEAGRHARADAIVTRDPKGFSKSKIRVYSPRELLKALSA